MVTGSRNDYIDRPGVREVLIKPETDQRTVLLSWSRRGLTGD
jgi:hypothetical protein